MRKWVRTRYGRRIFILGVLGVIGALTLAYSPGAVFYAYAKDAPSSPAQTAKEKTTINIQEVQSPGGIRAWLVEDHSVPVISLSFGFKGAGGKMDSAEKQGLAQLASNTLDEGAGPLDSQAFQGELQNLSISLGFQSGRDHFSGSLKTLTRNKDRAFELLRLALTEPRFDAEPVGRMKIANQSRLKRTMSEPDWIAARLQNDRIFEGHAYAQNSGGTLSSLGALTPEDLRGFMKRLGRDNLRVSASGDVSVQELGAILDKIFGGLGKAGLPAQKESALKNAGKTYIYHKDVPQTFIEIAQPGIPRHDPDYHAAQVMNFILGSSGFGSRLTEEVREKRGLTYGIYSYFVDLKETPVFQVSTSTETASTGEVLNLIREEWRKMVETDVSEKELADAKSYLIGSLPLSLTSTDKISGVLLSMLIDDLPIDYLDQREKVIKGMSEGDIRRVAQKVLRADAFTIVLVGKPESVKDAEVITSLPNVE